MDYLYRPYTPQDAPALNLAFRQVFKVYRDEAWWHQVYEQCPDGALAMLAFTAEGEVAGCYACTLHRVCDTQTGAILLGGQVRDVFTVPALRGASLRRDSVMVQLYRHFLEALACRFQTDFLFGFPSRVPLRLGKLMMGYQQLPRWQELVCRVNGPAAWSMALDIDAPADFDAGFDALWQSAKNHNTGIRVVRSSAFLRWRFGQYPQRYLIRTARQFLTRDISAYVVMRVEGTQATLLDWHWPAEPALARAFWGHLCAELQGKGVEVARVRVSGYSTDSTLLAALGFAPGAVMFDDFPVYRCFSAAVTDTAMLDRFAFTLADTDLL